MSDRIVAQPRETLRIALAARAFTLAAIGASAATSSAHHPLFFAATVVVGLAAQAASALPRVADFAVTLVEGAVVAAIASAVTGRDIVTMPYLAVPALIAGVLRGVRGVLTVVAVEFAVLAIGMAAASGPTEATEYLQGIVWLITSLGLGLLGSRMHKLVGARPDDESYRIAVGLIEQLHRVSGRLADGLDVGTIAENVLERVRTFVPVETAALITPGPSGRWTALRYAGIDAPDALRDVAPHAARVGRTKEPWSDRSAMAVPLTRDDNVVAVVIGRGHTIDASRVGQIDQALAGEALRLDAALLFADITASATHEERQRLAREIHDGLAQDLASLGYLLDGVDVTRPDANARLDGIREEITRVLQEVRHSVFSLRVDVSETRSLGEGVSALAQHVRAHSPIRVHESIDGGQSRLRADVEAQLLRITQEAMNNARKHSGAANIWVRCHLDPPLAEIEVLDDGSGLGMPREDSYGLKIMRERAERIGASLDIDTRPDSARGTRVLVRLGERRERG